MPRSTNHRTTRPTHLSRGTATATAVCGSLLIGLLFMGGCGRSNPNEPKHSLPSPSTASSGALRQFDSDGDQQLTPQELARVPALAAALPELDTSQDGNVSGDEIAQRIDYYSSHGAVMLTGLCWVTLDGRPLAHAEVTLDPEPFPGNPARQCGGKTNDEGLCVLATPGEQFPGAYVGFYRVRVSRRNKDGEETLPPEFNAQSTIGREIAQGRDDMRGGIRIALKRD